MTTTISAKTVKELRDMTGAGMMDCKRALADCEGDIEKAKDWLRKKGQAIADKKASRAANEGLVFLHITDDKKTAVALELNCETDFVARNEGFVELGEELSAHIAKTTEGTTNNNVEEYLEAPSPRDGVPSIKEHLRESVAKLAENITIGSFERVERKSEPGTFHTYVHPPGKLGVIVELGYDKPETAESEAFKEFCGDVAMHIAAAGPAFLSSSDVDSAALNREREIYMEQGRAEGKPDNIVEKIVEGRIQKYYKQVCLLDQEFVKDPDITITKLAEKVSKETGDKIVIVGFVRKNIGG